MKTGDLRQLGLRAHARGELSSAVELYKQTLEVGNDIQAVVNLGAALRSLNRLDEALDHYRFWRSRYPDHTQLLLNGANALLDRQCWEEAMSWVEPLIMQQRDPVAIRIKAKALINSHQLDAAASLLQYLLDQNPKDHDALLDQGLVELQRGELEQALNRFQILQQQTPDDVRLIDLSVRTRRQVGDIAGAREQLNSIPLRQKHNAVIQRLEAEQLCSEGQLNASCQAWRTLCLQQPETARHWLGWAETAFSLKQPTRACKILKDGIRWHPHNHGMERALLQALISRGHWSSTTLKRWQAVHAKTQTWTRDQLFSFQFLGSGFGLADPEQLRQAARTWEQQQIVQIQTPLWPDRLLQPLSGRRLRLGYLSADWRQHPVGQFMLPVLRQHDRTNVEVFGLNLTPAEDEKTNLIMRSCEHWLELPRHHRHGAARRIADLRLDVLIELGGFTEGSGLDLLLYRPAPVQLSYLGYFSSTHLNVVDGWIGDQELFCNELLEQDKLIELPGGAMALDVNQFPPLQATTPHNFRFGCFNHSRKLTDECLKLFSHCLEACPQAELHLKSPTFRDSLEQQTLRDRAADQGINNDRLMLLSWVADKTDHLNMYQQIDVALDPIPYGGATTTAEALSMGTPTVCLRGRGMVGCLSSSLLIHGNCHQWIANNADQYINIAHKLYQQGARNQASRELLRRTINNSPLGDSERLAKALEQRCREQRQKITTS